MKRAERNLILYNTVRDIYTALRDIEQQETLLVEANFVARVDALDRLSFHILERIENVQYVHGYHEELARLYHRGERLWQRLEGVNTQFSRAEGIKRWKILPRDFAQEEDEVTPTLKVRRRAIVAKYADEIDALYAS